MNELFGEAGDGGPVLGGDGFLGAHVGANADAGGAGFDPLGDVVEIYAASGCEFQLRQRREDVFEVTGAECGGGEDFDDVGAGLPGAEDFGRSE